MLNRLYSLLENFPEARNIPVLGQFLSLLGNLPIVNQYIEYIKDIQKYRLSPSELNALLYQLALQYNPEVAKQGINEFHAVVGKTGIPFVICPMSKDAESPDNEPNMPFICDTTQNGLNKYPGHVLLIPTGLVRGYFYLPTKISMFKGAHSIGLSIDPIQKESNALDPAGDYRDAYPSIYTKLKRVPGAAYKFKDAKFRNQQDSYSCGYYVYYYFKHILETGSVLGCEDIKLDIKKEYRNKADFLKKHHVRFVEECESDSDLDHFTMDGISGTDEVQLQELKAKLQILTNWCTPEDLVDISKQMVEEIAEKPIENSELDAQAQEFFKQMQDILAVDMKDSVKQDAQLAGLLENWWSCSISNSYDLGEAVGEYVSGSDSSNNTPTHSETDDDTEIEDDDKENTNEQGLRVEQPIQIAPKKRSPGIAIPVKHNVTPEKIDLSRSNSVGLTNSWAVLYHSDESTNPYLNKTPPVTKNNTQFKP